MRRETPSSSGNFGVILLACAALYLFFSSDIVLAQQSPPMSSPSETDMTAVNVPPTKSAGSGPQRYSLMTNLEFALSLIILAFGLIVIFVEYFLLRRSVLRADEVLRVFSLTLIVIGTLFFVTAGFNSNQVAPAMGLFGTIAGYLLGRRSTRTDRELSQPQRGAPE